MANDGSRKIRTPTNELELNNRLIEPAWGKDEVPTDFQEQVTKSYKYYDENGELVVDEKGYPLLKQTVLWDLLGFITKDFRQGNLRRGKFWDNIPDEVEFCEYWSKLSSDFLHEGYIECFAVALSNVALKLELTQSANGFFSKNTKTWREEFKSESVEPAKRTLMGGGGGGQKQ